MYFRKARVRLPESVERRPGQPRRLSVCVYVVFAGGWVPVGRRLFAYRRARNVWVSAHSFGWGTVEREPPPAWAEICLHPCAREPLSPAAGETGTERHPSSGAL